MDEDFAKKKAKCVEAIKGIYLLMAKNRIPLPSKYQKSRVHEDLPFDPKIREEEVLRRFKYLEPESREQMAEKLNDLLVYAEVAKVLRSELIAIVVLSKLRKWENLLLQPHLEMPPIPSPSPEQKRILRERKKKIEERDQRTENVLRQYERHGEDRRANIQSYNPFDVPARIITLPPQTIGQPQSRIEDIAPRVDLEEQRRRDIEAYQKFGAVRKRLHDLPEFQRDLKGPRLPDHELPLSSRNRQQGDSQSVYKELAQQKMMDDLRRQLKKSLSLINRNSNNQSDNYRPTAPFVHQREIDERRQNIENRDQRVATTLRQYEELGESRRAAVQSRNPFDERVRTITLPPQTIGPPQSQARGGTTSRIDVEEERRRDIVEYQKFGAIRKKLHDLPDFQRDLNGPKLPDHMLPLASSQSVAATPSRFPELEKQRTLDTMRRQLHQALTTHKRRRSNEPNNEQTATEGRNRQSEESIAERDRRIASVLRQHEELGRRRRAEVQSINPFLENVRTVRLPDQTIPLPTHSREQAATSTMLDIKQQRRRDIEEYQKFGAIRKQQHDLPDYQRNVIAPKLRAHGLPSTSKQNRTQAETRSRYKYLGKQRELDKLQRELQSAIQSRKRIRRKSPENVPQDNRNSNTDTDPENPVNDPENFPNNPENEQ